MKRCDYCGSTISYHEQYCSDECENNAMNYYTKESKYKNVFGFFNIACVIGITLSCFLGLIFSGKIACIAIGVLLMILGAVIFFIPLPTLNFIKIFKIKKSVFITKIIASAIFTAGILFLLSGLFF